MNSLNYYQTIFDKAGDAIFVHDIGSVEFMEVNEAAENLTGYSKSELTKRSVEKISAHSHGFDFYHALKKVQQAARHESITFEWIIQTQDPPHIPFELCLNRFEIKHQHNLFVLFGNFSVVKTF